MIRPQYFADIKKRIKKMKPGSAFTATDFFDIADTDPVNKALSRLQEEKMIRRVMQGIYDKPEYSELLQEYAAPQANKIAEALARKFNWTISPAGDIALNILHLSTQVPNTWSYISDGADRKFLIGSTKLEFRHRTNREISGYSQSTSLIIQAFKAIGREGVTREILLTLKANLTIKEKRRALIEGKTATAWIYQYIKQICR